MRRSLLEVRALVDAVATRYIRAAYDAKGWRWDDARESRSLRAFAQYMGTSVASCERDERLRTDSFALRYIDAAGGRGASRDEHAFAHYYESDVECVVVVNDFYVEGAKIDASAYVERFPLPPVGESSESSNAANEGVEV